MLIIPDASTLLKWVLPPENEEHVEQALDLAQAFNAGRLGLIVPSLWIYEVGNVLALKHPDLAEQQLSRLRRMEIPEIPPDEATVQRALRLVTTKKVSFYDAAYHAVAIVRQGLFVTADKKYLQAVGSDEHVMHLKDWR
jgi:predicted nucleic acid-binding protein